MKRTTEAIWSKSIKIADLLSGRVSTCALPGGATLAVSAPVDHLLQVAVFEGPNVVAAERARLRERVEEMRRERQIDLDTARSQFIAGGLNELDRVLALLAEPGEEPVDEGTADHDADCECLRCTAGRNAEEALAREEGWGEREQEMAEGAKGLCGACGSWTDHAEEDCPFDSAPPATR